MPATSAGRPPSDERPRVATPTDVSAAIAERRRREQRRRRLLVGVVASLLVLALLLAWLVRFSPVFAARAVQVNGTSRLTVAQVEQAAEVPLGQPLVALDSSAIGARVVNRLAPVAQVKVHTKLPNTVVIDVTERTPAFQRVASGQYQLTDSSGVIFAIESKPVKGLVQVTTPAVDNRLLAGLATVVQSLPPAVAKRVQQVTAPTADQITITLDKGQKVVWGSSEASADKARVLAVLIGQKASVFDVSSPANPTTR